MITVRDQSLKITDYKGRPTKAIASDCPCRPCWHPHDCGTFNSQGKWVMRMWCVTNWNSGCPTEDRTPVHVFQDKKRKCARCKAPRPTRIKENPENS